MSLNHQFNRTRLSYVYGHFLLLFTVSNSVTVTKLPTIFEQLSSTLSDYSELSFIFTIIVCHMRVGVCFDVSFNSSFQRWRLFRCVEVVRTSTSGVATTAGAFRRESSTTESRIVRTRPTNTIVSYFSDFNRIVILGLWN